MKGQPIQDVSRDPSHHGLHHDRAHEPPNGAALDHKVHGERHVARSATGKASGLGCLLCNTAVERAAADKATRRFVDRYFERLTDAFENALDNAQCAGDIDLEVDTIAQARFLTSAVLGIAVLVRAKAPPAIVEGAAEVALAHVASLVPA